MKLEAGQTAVKVAVDNDELMKKYTFVSDHAPCLWLSEADDGFWPWSVQDFFTHMEGVSHYDPIHNERKLML